MKLDGSLLKKDQIAIVDQKEVQKQQKFEGQIKLHPGQKLWEINLLTGDISEAQYDVEAANYDSAVKGEATVKRKLITKEHHSYIAAINKKVAFVKLMKRFKAALK